MAISRNASAREGAFPCPSSFSTLDANASDRLNILLISLLNTERSAFIGSERREKIAPSGTSSERVHGSGCHFFRRVPNLSIT
jgi:hypothetical protein